MSKSLVFIVANLDVGGAENHVIQIALGLKKSFISPSVFAILNKGILAKDLERSGVPVTTPAVKTSWNTLNKFQKVTRLIQAAVSLFFYLRKKRPDIVHLFLPMPYLLGGVVSLLAGVRVCVMSRRSLNYYQSKYFGIALIERLLHRRMSYVLGNSKAVLRDLRNEGVLENQLGLIYNGVNIPNKLCLGDRNKLREQIFVESTDLLIIMIANLIPYKGHNDLLYGLSKASTLLPHNWKLVCVGHDRHGIKNQLMSLSHELGIAESVHFLGGRNDVTSLLQASDIAVLCSHEEGFSNAILEAMAAGLASVVTDVGGNSEAIRDGVDGYVIQPYMPDDLGQAIARLLNDKCLRESMGMAARIRAETKFSAEVCVHGYEQLYRKLVTK